MSVLRTILRHNTPAGEPLSAGDGDGTPLHQPESELRLVATIGHNIVSDLR